MHAHHSCIRSPVGFLALALCAFCGNPDLSTISWLLGRWAAAQSIASKQTLHPCSWLSQAGLITSPRPNQMCASDINCSALHVTNAMNNILGIKNAHHIRRPRLTLLPLAMVSNTWLISMLPRGVRGTCSKTNEHQSVLSMCIRSSYVQGGPSEKCIY